MRPLLIISYGNPVRSDDGVAWHAAKLLEGKFAASEAEILCIHQLVPELAETASLFGTVIFVDAEVRASLESAAPGHIRIAEITQTAREKETVHASHALSPFTVIGMAVQFYGARLNAFTVTVTGQEFEHGESLSAPVAAALPELVRKIESLARVQLAESDKS